MNYPSLLCRFLQIINKKNNMGNESNHISLNDSLTFPSNTIVIHEHNNYFKLLYLMVMKTSCPVNQNNLFLSNTLFQVQLYFNTINIKKKKN